MANNLPNFGKLFILVEIISGHVEENGQSSSPVLWSRKNYAVCKTGIYQQWWWF